MSWLPFRYRDFYDVPRAILVEYDGGIYFLDCPFNDQLDEYGDAYSVYKLPKAPKSALGVASWEDLPGDAIYIGSVPVVSVEFDPTRRRSIDARVLERLEISRGR